MPRSKRNKQIELAKTKKRGLEWKKKLFEEIRKAVDSYSTVYVFTVNDMRNSKMKNVRDQWKDSRFFIGKNKIMAMSLGRFVEEEYKPNLHKIGKRIKGQRALLFSNRSTDDVLRWFRSYSEGDFARSGNTATEDVKLLEGPLPEFPHNLEPYLRQLGLPTTLVKGVIHLVKDHQVCKEGDILTPETAKILKLLGYEMAEFHITINCMWSQDGTFFKFTDDKESDTKENKNKQKSSSMVFDKTSNPNITEEMEVEEDELSDSSEVPELREIECNTSKVMTVENNPDASPAKALNSNESTSTSKVMAVENNPDVSPTKAFISSASTPKVIAIESNPDVSLVKAFNSSASTSTPKVMAVESNPDVSPTKAFNSSASTSTPKVIAVESNPDVSPAKAFNSSASTSTPEIMAVKNNPDVCPTKAFNSSTSTSTPEIMAVESKPGVSPTIPFNINENKSTPNENVKNSVEIKQNVEECNQNLDECTILSAEKEINFSEDTPVNKKKKMATKPSNSVKKADTISRRGRLRKRPANSDVVLVKDSILKTPDNIADSSQDSPVFRELRNRSVKVNRKRNK